MEVKGGIGTFSPRAGISWLCQSSLFTAVCGDLSVSIMTPVWCEQGGSLARSALQTEVSKVEFCTSPATAGVAGADWGC